MPTACARRAAQRNGYHMHGYCRAYSCIVQAWGAPLQPARHTLCLPGSSTTCGDLHGAGQDSCSAHLASPSLLKQALLSCAWGMRNAMHAARLLMACLRWGPVHACMHACRSLRSAPSVAPAAAASHRACAAHKHTLRHRRPAGAAARPPATAADPRAARPAPSARHPLPHNGSIGISSSSHSRRPKPAACHERLMGALVWVIWWRA